MKVNRIKFKPAGAGTFLCWLAVLCLVNTSGNCEDAYQYESYGRRDPFVPLIGVSEGGTTGGIHGILTIDDVSFQGILVGEDGKNSVVINGEILKEGDRVERLYVESIGDNIVKIKIDEDSFELKLYE